MNQMLDQFAKQSIAVKLFLLIILVGVIGIVEYQAKYVPLNQQVRTEEKKAADLKVKLLENQAIADNLPKFQEEVNSLNEQLRQAVSLLPNRTDVQAILRQLSITAKKADVDLLFFRPGGVRSRGFYSEIGVELRIRGSYHDIAGFVDAVGKLNRIMNISDIVYSSPEARGGRIILTADCKLTTFMFRGRR